jgi:alkyl hydroperoxide reductase subunit AhpC
MLPQLEALYKKWHKEGLEIIGINFDAKAETGPKRCKDVGITYPQVWVPSDEKTRQLWEEAAGIRAVGRFFLVDRDGILRVDTTSELETKIADLLKDSRSR